MDNFWCQMANIRNEPLRFFSLRAYGAQLLLRNTVQGHTILWAKIPRPGSVGATLGARHNFFLGGWSGVKNTTSRAGRHLSPKIENRGGRSKISVTRPATGAKLTDSRRIRGKMEVGDSEARPKWYFWHSILAKAGRIRVADACGIDDSP